MNPPSTGDPLPAFNFLSEFLPAPDFGKSFRFDRLFNFDDGAFIAGNSPLVGGYDNDSCSFSVESYVRNGCRHHHHRKCRANYLYRKQSVLLSPWYVNFLCPGFARDLIHELSSSDCFGEFCSLFQMKLEKVEERTDILINRGYICEPQSLQFCAEFHEHSELLVLTQKDLARTSERRQNHCHQSRQCPMHPPPAPQA